jgi:hypothetical protein
MNLAVETNEKLLPVVPVTMNILDVARNSKAIAAKIFRAQ